MTNKHLTAWSLALALALAGCNQGNKDTQNAAEAGIVQTENTAGTASDNNGIDENTEVAPFEVSLTGDIDPKTWTAGQEASVTIDRFPNSLAEFKQLQKQLGNTPQGAVMIQLAAFELYNRNTDAGTEAIKLCNVESNVNSVLRIIQDKFGKNNLNPGSVRKFLVATYLDGATPQNAYNPSKPYTIHVRSSKVNDYQRSEMLKGYVLYLQVHSSAYDTEWRGCEVIKQKGNEYYSVSNCPAMYTGCKDIDFECEEEYQGL